MAMQQHDSDKTISNTKSLLTKSPSLVPCQRAEICYQLQQQGHEMVEERQKNGYEEAHLGSKSSAVAFTASFSSPGLAD